MKRAFNLFIVLTLLLFSLTDFSGFSVSDPLQSSLMISGICFGKTDEEYDISFLYIDYSKESRKNEYRPVSYSSPTIGGCIYGAENNYQAGIYFGQTDVVFIERDILSDTEMYGEIINYLERNPYIGYSIYVYIVDGEMNEFTEKISAQDDRYIRFLDDLIIREPAKGDVNTHLLDIVSEYDDYFVPVVSSVGQNIISSLGCFGSGEYLGDLDSSVFRQYGILNNLGGKYYYDTSLGEFYTDKTKTTIRYDGGCDFTINVSCNFSSLNLDGYNSLQGRMIRLVEEEFADTVKTDILDAIAKVKQYGYDIIGLEKYMHRFYSSVHGELQKRGINIIRDGNFNVIVECEFRNNGVMY